ncbi:MAG: hypothetical protein EBT75_06165 [Proteobacteria bacterium]|nr:hypothetical protein [Pseudomonadota bacterium]
MAPPPAIIETVPVVDDMFAFVVMDPPLAFNEILPARVIVLLIVISVSAIKVSEFALPVFAMLPFTVMNPAPDPVLLVDIVTDPKPKAVNSGVIPTVAVLN